MPVFDPPLDADGMWELTEADLRCVSLGAAILGTGGGGSPYLGWLRAREQLRSGRRIRIVKLEDLSNDALVISTSGIGAPTVGIEKFEKGDECASAVETLEDYLGHKADAVMTDEIGGSNALEPMIVAALKDVPVADADGMGRAFPEVQMTTFFIYGVEPFPTALCDEKGNRVLFESAHSAEWLEGAARAVTIQMGCTAGMAGPPMSAQRARRVAISGTVRQAWRLGREVLAAREAKADPVSAVLEAERGRLLFQGKIIDVVRRTTRGFAMGDMTLEGLDDFAGTRCAINFQNENLVCRLDDYIVATVPDLICILESETGTAVTTEELRYGYRVSVVGIPAPSQLRTPRALEVVGPRAFGLELDYRPL